MKHIASANGARFPSRIPAIRLLAERYPQVPRIALTATADAATRADIKHFLHLEDAPEFISSFDRPNIYYQVIEKTTAKSSFSTSSAKKWKGKAASSIA